MVACGMILVADSDPPTVEFIAEALMDEGYQVRRASNWADATTALLTDSLDLALMDLWLAGMSGIDVLCAVRAQAVDIPIVIMTANTLQARALEAQGAATCLLKPFDLDDLLICVARHIRLRSAYGDRQTD